MTHAEQVHLHHRSERQEKAKAQVPYWKRVHHDWKFWIALSLMLTAMVVYIVTLDLSVVPGVQTEETGVRADH